MKPFNFLLVIIVLLTLLRPSPVANAQSGSASPTYTVQSGDTLGGIAQKFGVTLDDLIRANNISNPNNLTVGTTLVIPGISGVKGALVTDSVQLGENFSSILARYHLPFETFIILNRITSPAELYVGSSIVLPKENQKSTLLPRAIVQPGISSQELALVQNQNAWVMAEINRQSSASHFINGQTIYDYPRQPGETAGILHPAISKINISPLPLVQGSTAVVRITTKQPINLTGELGGKSLTFFPLSPNEYVAMQGVHAMADIGVTSIKLEGSTSGSTFKFEQSLLVKSGNFRQDIPLSVDPKTIDPANTKPEDDQILNIIKPVTTTRYWSKVFRSPTDEPDCIMSAYGNRRSYNGSPYTYFHSGVDYGVCAKPSLNIYTPAPGKVVFTGLLTVRGNATIIDHGWGIYSGYWHQSAFKVKVGDEVKAGQLIGLIGGTGRVSGPHLHWEIWVNGVQVEPLDWLDAAIP